MPDIASLTSQVQQLGRDVAFWGTFVRWSMFFTAILGVAYFIFIEIQSSKAGALADKQQQLIAAKDEQLARDLKEKDLQIGKANEAAGNANERAGILEKEAAEQRRIAGELEKQNLATATQLEAERAKRLALERAVAPREIPFSIMGEVSTLDPLRPLKGTTFVFETISNEEARRAATNISGLLKEAGADTKVTVFLAGTFPDGVTISYREYVLPDKDLEFANDPSAHSAKTLAAFLIAYDWKEVQMRPVLIGGANDPNQAKLPAKTVRVLVGFKPVTYFRESATGLPGKATFALLGNDAEISRMVEAIKQNRAKVDAAIAAQRLKMRREGPDPEPRKR